MILVSDEICLIAVFGNYFVIFLLCPNYCSCSLCYVIFTAFLTTSSILVIILWYIVLLVKVHISSGMPVCGLHVRALGSASWGAQCIPSFNSQKNNFCTWASRFSAQEDEDDAHPNLLRRTTIGNGLLWVLIFLFVLVWCIFYLNLIVFIQVAGPPESVFDWTREFDSEFSNQNTNNQAFSRKHWRLLQCQNGKYFHLAYIS